MNMGIFNGLTGIFNGVLERRAQRSEMQFQVEMAGLKAKAEATTQINAADANWENVMANKSGWMDDYWTIILSIPLVMAFIPALQEYVNLGFQALRDNVPEWYVWALLASISAAFARRKLPNIAGIFRK